MEGSHYLISGLTGKVLKTAWCWQTGRRINYWEEGEVLEIDPHEYGPVTFTVSAKEPRGGRVVFPPNSAESAGAPHASKSTLMNASALIKNNERRGDPKCKRKM